MSTARYLLVKAHVGFADRLQCLSHAFKYAKAHERTLCIDWGDTIWSDGILDFHTYFDLCDVPIISKHVLFEKNFSSIEPLAWANQLERPADSKFIYRSEYACNLGDEDSAAELLVYASTGDRIYYMDNLCKLRVRREIRNLIIDKLREYASFPYVVHLRGTDRVPAERYSEYLEGFRSRMEEISRTDPVLVVSDCLPLFRRFQDEFPGAVLRTPNLDQFDPAVGTHMQTRVSKHKSNIELLIDFFLLVYARMCFYDPDTLFSKMARFIHEGDYHSILGYDEPLTRA